jgi:hypothetical protein
VVEPAFEVEQRLGDGAGSVAIARWVGTKDLGHRPAAGTGLGCTLPIGLVAESDSVEAIQDYVDSTLGDSSVNTCWQVDTELAFAEQPLGLRTPRRDPGVDNRHADPGGPSGNKTAVGERINTDRLDRGREPRGRQPRMPR